MPQARVAYGRRRSSRYRANTYLGTKDFYDNKGAIYKEDFQLTLILNSTDRYGPMRLIWALSSLVCYHRALCTKEVTKRNRSAIVSDGSLSKDVIPSPLNRDVPVDYNLKICLSSSINFGL